MELHRSKNNIPTVNVVISASDGSNKEQYANVLKDDMGIFIMQKLIDYLIKYNKESNRKTALENIVNIASTTSTRKDDELERRYNIKMDFA